MNTENPPKNQSEEVKTSWRQSYTWVLLANAAYILVFYLLMKIFA
jgi:hypothetical protein